MSGKENKLYKDIILDTLAKSVTNYQELENNSNNNNSKYKSKYYKRARAKYFSNNIMPSFADLAKHEGNNRMEKSYWNTWHCCNSFIVDENKLKGKYCKNRFCPVCLKIKTATHILKYKPILEQWEHKQFVTLTVPDANCNKDNLLFYIEYMLKNLSNIKNIMKLREFRKTGKKLEAIRKLEVTHTETKFHPHFHLVVKDKEAAAILKEEWLKQWRKNPIENEGDINEDCQNIKDVNNDEIIELFKYMAKFISNTSGGNISQNGKVLINPLHTIFKSIRGKHIIRPIGFKIPKIDEAEIEVDLPIDEVNKLIDRDEYLFIKGGSDWISLTTGELLTGYVPAESFESLLKNNIIVNFPNSS